MNIDFLFINILFLFPYVVRIFSEWKHLADPDVHWARSYIPPLCKSCGQRGCYIHQHRPLSALLTCISICCFPNKQNTASEEAQSMESCQSEDIWFTPPCNLEDERDEEDSLPIKAFYETEWVVLSAGRRRVVNFIWQLPSEFLLRGQGVSSHAQHPRASVPCTRLSKIFRALWPTKPVCKQTAM